jgi:hypothetical protein
MQCLFFATAQDLALVFELVEARNQLGYTRTGLFESESAQTVYSGSAIPTLRTPAPDASAVAGYAYLVQDRDLPVVVREVPQRNGATRFAIDQLANPESVVLLHGGLFTPNVLLHGSVGTASDTPRSRQLQHAFAAAIADSFERVHSYYVGAAAVELWKSGCRLTISASSPTDYDLVA